LNQMHSFKGNNWCHLNTLPLCCCQRRMIPLMQKISDLLVSCIVWQKSCVSCLQTIWRRSWKTLCLLDRVLP
jgi:hypothetical protein